MEERRRKQLQVIATAVVLMGQLAYIVLPFDILPDFIPFLGWIDDLLALSGFAGTAFFFSKLLQGGGYEAFFPAPLEQVEYEPVPPEVLRTL